MLLPFAYRFVRTVRHGKVTLDPLVIRSLTKSDSGSSLPNPCDASNDSTSTRYWRRAANTSWRLIFGFTGAGDGAADEPLDVAAGVAIRAEVRGPRPPIALPVPARKMAITIPPNHRTSLGPGIAKARPNQRTKTPTPT